MEEEVSDSGVNVTNSTWILDYNFLTNTSICDWKLQLPTTEEDDAGGNEETPIMVNTGVVCAQGVEEQVVEQIVLGKWHTKTLYIYI